MHRSVQSSNMQLQRIYPGCMPTASPFTATAYSILLQHRHFNLNEHHRTDQQATARILLCLAVDAALDHWKPLHTSKKSQLLFSFALQLAQLLHASLSSVGLVTMCVAHPPARLLVLHCSPGLNDTPLLQALEPISGQGCCGRQLAQTASHLL